MPLDGIAFRDRETRQEKRTFAKIKGAEENYARQLRKVARIVGDIIRQFTPGDPALLPQLDQLLTGYSKLLTPWAKATATRMIGDVQRRDDKVWAQYAQTMSRALKAELATTPLGQTHRDLMDMQVTLITSIPLDAAQRVHKLTMEGLLSGQRFKEIVPEIMRSGQVTQSRANLIARTETARARSTLSQARAEWIGSEGYIWKTSNDQDVRPSHRRLDGKFFRWDDPPISEADGHTRSHPGQVWNCRCNPEIIIPSKYLK